MVHAQSFRTRYSRAAMWQGLPYYGKLSPHDKKHYKIFIEHEAHHGFYFNCTHKKSSQKVLKNLLHMLLAVLVPNMSARINYETN